MNKELIKQQVQDRSLLNKKIRSHKCYTRLEKADREVCKKVKTKKNEKSMMVLKVMRTEKSERNRNREDKKHGEVRREEDDRITKTIE